MNIDEKVQARMLNQLAAFTKRVIAVSEGRKIQSFQLNETTGELHANYDNGETDNLGRITGGDGDPGVSIIDVQLIDGDAGTGDVFVESTLSNGVKIKTQSSLSGYNGHSIAGARSESNSLIFNLDDVDNTELPPVPVDGLTALGIKGARIDEGGFLVLVMDDDSEISAGIADDLAGRGIDSLGINEAGELEVVYSDSGDGYNLGRVRGVGVSNIRIEDGDIIFTLSDTTEINLGAAETLQGVGIAGLSLDGGKLKVQYTDSPDWVELGDLDGVASMAVVDGNLVYRKNSDDATDIIIDAFSTITGAKVVGNELIFMTNQPEPNHEINVGQVNNLKGDTGKGYKSVTLANNILTFTYSDDSTDEVSVDGLNPVKIVGARYDADVDDVIFIMDDDTEISSGIKEDMRGRGIASMEMADNGVLTVVYDGDPTKHTLGVVKYVDSFEVVDGQILVTYNTSSTPVVVGDILSVKTFAVEDGRIVVTLTDDSKIDLGNARGVDNIQINAEHELIFTYSDGEEVNVGKVQGSDGVGYVGATINASGDLVLTNSEGTDVNAGSVRTQVSTLLGTIVRFTATAGQDSQTVTHSGEAVVIVDSAVLDPSLYDTSVTEEIGFTPPLVGGESVQIMAFAPAANVISDRGIVSCEESSAGIYTIQLEDGTTFDLDTNTAIDVTTLPPGITAMEVNQSGNLIVTLSDGNVVDAGATSNANNIKSVEIDGAGDLKITLDDETTINAGSVMSQLAITDVNVDGNGDLLVTMNSGETFNAGATGIYITAATINPSDGEMTVNLSDGNVITVGHVHNPLIGTFYDQTAFEGQTDFPLVHDGYKVAVFANSAKLSKAAVDLSDPNLVKLNTPRREGDLMSFMVFASTDAIHVEGLQSEAAAPDDTFYGKVGGVVGWHSVASKLISAPRVFVALAGQTLFLNIPHDGKIENVEIVIDGEFIHDGFTLGDASVIMTNPLTGGEKVRISSLRENGKVEGPSPDSFVHLAYRTYSNGGSMTQDVWMERTFNLVLSDGIGVVLDKNRLTLPSGTYFIRGWVNEYGLGSTALRVYATGSRSEKLMGGAGFSERASKSFIEGYFTLENQDQIAIQQISAKSVASHGQGKCGDGTTASVAVQQRMGIPASHAEIQLWKVA